MIKPKGLIDEAISLPVEVRTKNFTLPQKSNPIKQKIRNQT